jgi:2-methylisocitrate lyase-like PEP mutase family enzyme
MKATTRLRQLLAAKTMLVAPGAYDGITARLVEQAGFSAVYMTGAGTSMAHGFPDFGLLGISEMIENAAVMTRTVEIPLISDADTGYGNELNVTRAVREFEARGVAGIHIEDQVSPKRCGHLDGKEIVAQGEFLSKIRAAVAARRDPDFLIIARTDSRAVAGFDEAIARANAALGAGADMAFVEAVESAEELALVPQRVNGPCLLNIVSGGAVLVAVDKALRTVKETGIPHVSGGPKGAGPADTFRRFGADEWNALRQRFAAQA